MDANNWSKLIEKSSSLKTKVDDFKESEKSFRHCYSFDDNIEALCSSFILETEKVDHNVTQILVSKLKSMFI